MIKGNHSIRLKAVLDAKMNDTNCLLLQAFGQEKTNYNICFFLDVRSRPQKGFLVRCDVNYFKGALHVFQARSAILN